MQLKIAKQLNNFLIFLFVLMLALGVGLIFLTQAYPQHKMLYAGVFIVLGIVFFCFFRWLEQRWDKRIITQMAERGKIALAHIKMGKRITNMRDSGFTSYWLYEFGADLYEPEHHKLIEKTFYEKMNASTKEIPQGWVYVTYDEKKPNQIFIIPNVLISHLPQLAPVVQQYERDQKLSIKYLDAFYDKGIVLQSIRQSVAQAAAKKQEMQGTKGETPT